MRLDLLIDRENFSEVFIKTFSKYLFDEYNWLGEIIWEEKRSKKLPKVLWVNKRLNIIYPKKISNFELRIISKEYSYNPNLLKRLLQRLYVRFAFSFEVFFVNSSIYISPWIGALDNKCIIPGNHSIRIIDLDLNQCKVILKEGFNKNFLINEINLRKQNPFLPIPKLLEVSEDNKSFIEERITAMPLNRIDDESIKSNSLKEAQKSMLQLYQLNQKTMKVKDWLKNLFNLLNLAINELPAVYSNKEKEKINNLINWLKEISLQCASEEIEIVQSHGDFQPANIMIDTSDGNKLYLIDWEYSNKRSFFYDSLVFASMSRSPKNFANRIHNMIDGNDYSSWQWCFGSNSKKKQLLNWMIGVFLLEDLLVRLQQLMIPDLKKKDDGLETWLSEVNKMNWLK